MAITDRNLSIGTQLYARYKGATHTCTLVATAAGPRYRLSDGREFKSPSAAGAAIMGEGRTCNGWAFWTVGDGTTGDRPGAECPRGAGRQGDRRTRVAQCTRCRSQRNGDASAAARWK